MMDLTTIIITRLTGGQLISYDAHDLRLQVYSVQGFDKNESFMPFSFPFIQVVQHRIRLFQRLFFSKINNWDHKVS